MQIFNDTSRYGFIAKMLHWLIAILIIGMLGLGLYMVTLKISPEKLKLFGWHKEYGLLVLMLAMLRLGWRFGNVTPLMPFGMPAWQRLAAHAVHWALYGFMFAMPLTGWLLTSAAGLPPAFFGLFVLPPLIAPNQDALEFFSLLHKCFAYSLIVVLGLHIGAALHHHFIEKDGILRRML